MRRFGKVLADACYQVHIAAVCAMLAILYRPRCSFTKHVGQPLDPLLPAPDQNRVETAGALGAVRGEVMRGGGEEPSPFGHSDAGRGAAVVLGAAGAHLDEHQDAAGRADDVDFAEAAAVVSLEDLQAPALEESGGEILVGI